MTARTLILALLGATLSLYLVGCDSHVITPVETKEELQLEAPPRFSWVVDSQLAGMAHPGMGDMAEASYDYLEGSDVSLLVSLTETSPVQTSLADRGIDHLHLPVADFTAPTLQQLDDFVTMTATELWFGGRVTVHCAGGRGRTGTFLAAWFVAEGMDADEAIDHVRTLRPGSIETTSQTAIIAQYAETLQ